MKKNILFKCVLSVLMVGALTLTILTNRRAKAEDFWQDGNIYNRTLYIYGLNQYGDAGNNISVYANDYIGNIIDYSWNDLDNVLEIFNYVDSQYYTFENGNKMGVYIVFERDRNINYFETGTIILSSSTSDAIVNPIWSISNSTYDFQWEGVSLSFYKIFYQIPNNVNYPSLTLLQKNKFMYDVIQLSNPLNILDNNHNKGYLQGYEVGYNAGQEYGFEQGKSYEIEHSSTTSWIANLSSGIANILDINLAPNIKLGYIILVPLVFGLVMAILKLIRG